MNCFSGRFSSLPGIQCDRQVKDTLNFEKQSLKTNVRFDPENEGPKVDVAGDQFFLSAFCIDKKVDSTP